MKGRGQLILKVLVYTFIAIFSLQSSSIAKDKDTPKDFLFNGCPSPEMFGFNPNSECSSKNIKCPYPMELIKGLDTKTGSFTCGYSENGRLVKTCEYVLNSCAYGTTIDKREVKDNIRELQNPIQSLRHDYTLSRILAGMVTFNDNVVEAIKNEVQRSEGGNEQANIYLFFVDFFNGIQNNITSLSAIFLALGTIYIFGVAGYYRFLASIGEQVQPINVKDTALRIISSVFIFMFPVSSGSSNSSGNPNETTYYPLIWKAIQFSIDAGNRLADEVSDVAGGAFVRYIFLENKERIQKTIDLLEPEKRKWEEKYNSDKSEWQNHCLRYWDIVRTFKDESTGKEYSIVLDIDQVTCKAIPPKEGVTITDYAYDCEYCRKLQNHLETSAKNYYLITSFIDFAKKAINRNYVGGNVKLTEIEVYQPPKGVVYPFVSFVAQEKDLQKSLGWINLFGTIGPITATYPIFIEEKKGPTIVNPSDKGGKDEGLVDKVAGFIGNIAYLSIPPGSTIFSFLDKVKDTILKGITENNIVSLFSGIPFLGNFVGGTIFGFAVDLSASLITIVAAIKITMYVLSILPLVVFTIAGSLKLVFYLIEVLKLVLASPFVFIWSMTIQNRHNIVLFFSRIIKLSMVPTLIVLSGVTALFSYRILFILSADLPAYLYTYIESTYSTLDISSMQILMMKMLFGIMKSILYVLASLGASFMIIKLIMGGDELFIEMFGQVQGITQQGIRGLAESMAERKARIINPI